MPGRFRASIPTASVAQAMSERLTGGLYAITDAALIPDDFLDVTVAEAIAGGARLIQYRDKSHAAARRFQQARTLLTVCRNGGVPLIINDDVELALAAGADGVHLGRDDQTPDAARRRLGTTALIGISCYNSLERALAAQHAGADYVAFGSFFPSPTKPQAAPADVALLREARRWLRIPIVAIGGITPLNGRALIEAGAAYLAVIHGVFGQPDCRLAARAYNDLFKQCWTPQPL
jgi:thiamine-phosphate pyrophosphorylase